MANIQYSNWTPSQLNAEFTHAASVEAEIGDLLWWDSASAVLKPASQISDMGTAALTQQLFASVFAGVSASRQLSTDSTARRAKSVIDVIVEFPCESSTYEVGDYVAPTYTAGVLSDQQVSKVTDPTRAIGKVVKRYSSATTTVKVHLTSPLFSGLKLDVGAGGSFAAGPATSTSDTGDAVSYIGGAGFPTTSGTGSAGGTATVKGGVGGLATTGTGGAGGASTFGGSVGGTATTGTAGAGGATTVVGGAGGAASAAAGIGGAGGTLTVTAGAGGASSHASGGNAGAGAAYAAAGGAGGAATGTGAAAGGVGGAASVTGGVGGTAAGTSAAGAGGASSLIAGAGGAKTGTGAAAGGAGGAAAVTAGAGGATASSGSDAGGAGGAVTITAGAGGAASAGTGNGGAGGSITLSPGAGGSTTGGTAGVAGIVRVGGTNPVPLAQNLARNTVSNGGTVTVAQVRGGVLYQDASGGNVTMTSPTAGNLDTAFPDLATGHALMLYVCSNHATNTSTISGGTGVTLVGSGAVTQTGGTFILHRTGSAAYDLVRVG